jgi:cytochrome c oxidase subunit IV
MTAHPQVDSIKTYGLVFLTLIVLTIFTTAVSFVDLGSFSVVAALVFAVCKAMLVALFFMHLRHSTVLTRLVVVGGLLWLLILLFLTFADYATRGALGVPGR